jgi:hypothetical protein
VTQRKDNVDDLIALMDARLILLVQQVDALRAAIAALRGLPVPQTVNVPSVWVGDVAGQATVTTTGRHPAKSKMPSHLCGSCHGRTTWDPCHLCGAPVPTIATLTTLAPGPHADEDD